MDERVWLGIGAITKQEAITPHDDAVIEYDGIYVGTGGNIAVSVKNDAGASVIWRNVVSGTIIQANIAKILSTGTTAQHLIGLILQK